MSFPSKSTRPDVGLSKPPISFSKELLPQPDEPSNVKNSPALMSSVTSSTARVGP